MNVKSADMKKKPIISIITVVYNACATLENTIKSVINQGSDFLEFWIIDGNSNDGSLEIIKKYERYLTGWISEPDNGIYDAMNKAVDRASGDWLFFLGADDQINEGIIETIIPYLDSSLGAVYGKVVYDNGYGIRSKIGLRSLLENTLHHQSAFYNRKLFEDFRYDIQYKINADYELTLRLYFSNYVTLSVPYVIAVCGSGGASSILNSYETNHLRGRYVRNVYLNNILSRILDGYYSYHKFKGVVKAKAMGILRKNSIL